MPTQTFGLINAAVLTFIGHEKQTSLIKKLFDVTFGSKDLDSQ